MNSIKSSFGKELKSTGIKKLNHDILVDTELNIAGTNIKKEISSIQSLGLTLKTVR